MMDLLFIHLKISMQKRNAKAKLKCTVILMRFFCCSDKFGFRFMPSISIQNEEVSAVKAPSALKQCGDQSDNKNDGNCFWQIMQGNVWKNIVSYDIFSIHQELMIIVCCVIAERIYIK